MKLSDHFTLEEMVFSQTASRNGIDNDPPMDALRNLYLTAALLENVRSLIGKPIFVTSGYRSTLLNDMVNGSPSSAHIDGRAADIVAPSYGSVYDLAEIIAVHDNLQFDKLILEFGRWVHISIDDNPRRQVMTAKYSDVGGVVYFNGLIL